MPWQAGGTFNRLYSWNADASAGFDILADRMDDDTNDIVSGVERCRNLDGYNLPSINLPMGGFRHTGVGAATGNDQYARFDQVMQPSGGTFTGPVTFTSITATGATINGALGVTGTATLGAASIGAGAVSLNNTGISTPALNSSGAGSFGSLTVSGNFSGAGEIAGDRETAKRARAAGVERGGADPGVVERDGAGADAGRAEGGRPGHAERTVDRRPGRGDRGKGDGSRRGCGSAPPPRRCRWCRHPCGRPECRSRPRHRRSTSKDG